MASKIEKELVEVTDIYAKRNENPETYRQRLIEAVSELPDKAYNGLSKPARTWAKAAIEQFNSSGEVPEFNDLTDDADEEEAADDEIVEAAGNDEEEAAVPAKKQNKRTGRGGARSDEGDEERVGSAKKAPAHRANKTTKVPEEKGPTKKAAKGNGATKSGGGLHYARKLIAKNPEIEIGDLATRVEKAGYEISSHTLSTTKSGFLAAIKALQEVDLLKKKLV